MSEKNVQNRPCLWLVALLGAKYCPKVVHELYAPNELGRSFICIYDLCSWITGIEICYENLKLLALFVLAHSVVLGCVHIVSYTF